MTGNEIYEEIQAAIYEEGVEAGKRDRIQFGIKNTSSNPYRHPHSPILYHFWWLDGYEDGYAREE